MANLLLVNPKRRRKHKARRVRRMTAKQALYFAPRRNPKRRRHTARRSNPHRRRHYARRHNPIRRHHYRRNPSFRNIGAAIMPTVEEGAWGAGGALLADLAYGFGSPYLPAGIVSTPGTPIYFLLKALLALGVGMGGNMVFKGKGRVLGVGAMTVAIHDFAKASLLSMVPSLPLGAYLQVAPNVSGLRDMPGYTPGAPGLYNPRVRGAAALRQDTYRPVGRIGGERMGVYLGSMRGAGTGLAYANYADGIPPGGG
jgi:hypothetical protein